MKGRVTISRSREELKEILSSTKPPTSLIPELIEAAKEPELVCDRPSAPMVQAAAEPYLADIENIPRLTYTRYRDVQRYTNRYIYRVPQFEKRAKMATAAVQVLFGKDEYLSTLHDYIWSTCEETKWILPQREDLEIDLRVCGTGFTMAELIVGLEHKLEDRVVKRVREEIDRRVFARYLDRKEGWWKGHNNWNGVCNGGVGAMFLLLEDDVDRLAHGLHHVLEGLEVFINTAFESDGGSGEGVGYWHYGLTNFSFFAELLRHRTNGEIDLLGTERMATIARYPSSVMLSPGRYFSPREGTEFSPEHDRISPMLHFTEREVWQAIHAYGIPFCKLYAEGYRSLGARVTTGAADDIPAWEQDLENTSERVGRRQDKEGLMKKLRELGYM